MSDLIDRQAAIDAFGLSEKTRKYGGDHSGYDTRMLYEIQDTLESLPSAQPEIIRCKDCKHYLHDEEYGFDWCNRMSGVFRAKPDGFCSWAVMRGGDSNE